MVLSSIFRKLVETVGSGGAIEAVAELPKPFNNKKNRLNLRVNYTIFKRFYIMVFSPSFRRVCRTELPLKAYNIL